MGTSGLVLIGLALLPIPDAPSPARGREQTLTLQWRTHRNRHSRGHRSAAGVARSSNVSLTLGAEGKAQVLDTGHRRFYRSSALGSYRAERYDWTHHWIGTWKRKGAELQLRLKLKRRYCKGRVTKRGEKPQHRKCEAQRRRLLFRCTTTRVKAWIPSANNPRRYQRWAWSCTPKTFETQGTPTPWVFGKGSCLKVIGTGGGWSLMLKRGPRSYERCTR